MKKAVLSAAILLLLLCFSPAALADVIYPNPAPMELGQALDHLAASVEPGSRISVVAGTLPPGVALETEEHEDAMYVYLRGVPTEAGDFDAMLSVDDQGTFLCSVSVRPAMPSVNVGPSVVCSPNELAQVSVSAWAGDEGQLSYQWYTSPGGTGSSPIAGANEPVYQPGTAYPGVTYYYCVVTNTVDGVSVSAVSPTVSVTVEERSVIGLSLQSMPYKTEYLLGEYLDTTGLTLALSYSNGDVETISGGFRVTPTRLDSTGLQTVEVEYQGWQCSFQVAVQEEPELVEGIGVLTLPYRTVYSVGELLDTSGLSIRAYTNKGWRDVSEGLQCSPQQLNAEGSQTITVSYAGRTCSFSVTVEAEEKPSYLALYRLPDKLNYTVGDVVDTTGMQLQLISNKNNAMWVNADYSVYPTRLDRAGQQDITVSYGGFSCRFTVNVAEKTAASPSPAPSQPPVQTAQPVPSAQPTPGALPVTPGPTSIPVPPAPTARPVKTVGGGHGFLVVIVVASVLALSVLGLYVYIMNRGGFDALEDALRRMFRRRK